MGLSTAKKLDCRRALAGDGGTDARLSIVLSDKEGLDDRLVTGV